MSLEDQRAYRRYEILASKFYNDTGMLAPGKDDVLNTHDYDERWKTWTYWLKEKQDNE